MLGAAAAIVVLAATSYCAVGYLHYKRIADDERAAAQRAERANADLQDALNRLHDELAAVQAQSDATGETAAPDQADRVTQLTPVRALFDLPLDTELKMPAATLNWQPTPRSGRVSGQPRARSSRDQTRATLQQLGAERDEALSESGRLNARASELEEKLSLLQ